MDTPASGKFFEYSFSVTGDHLDDRQHVNNVVYVQWMQEAADKHWNSVVDSEFNNSLFWVVRHHAIDYLTPAFLHDILLMRTWTGENSAVTWERGYEIIRPSDRKKIITAKSVWVLMDRSTGKPQKINEKTLQRFD